MSEHNNKVFPSLKRRFTFGAFWSLVGNLCARGGNVLAGIIVARLLGREIFGQYGMVQSSVYMFAAFGALGLGITSTKYVAEWRNNEKLKAGRIEGFCSLVGLASGLLLAAIMYLCAPYLAGTLLSAPGLVDVLKVSSLLLFFTAWNGAQTGSLRGFEAFKDIGIINALSGFLLVAFTAWGAHSYYLLGAIWGWVCALAIQCFLTTYTLLRVNAASGVKISFRVSNEEVKLFWKFSLPASLSGLLFSPVIWAGNALLINSTGGFSEMGQYIAGYQWFAILLFLPGIINNTLLPMLAEKKGNKDIVGLNQMFIWGIKLILAILGPLVLLIAFFSKPLMRVYGEGFENGWIVLSILACAAFLAGIQSHVGNMLVVMDRMWLSFRMNLFWSITFLVTSCFFIKTGFGAVGLALATLCSYGARLLWLISVVLTFVRDGSSN